MAYSVFFCVAVVVAAALPAHESICEAGLCPVAADGEDAAAMRVSMLQKRMSQRDDDKWGGTESQRKAVDPESRADKTLAVLSVAGTESGVVASKNQSVGEPVTSVTAGRPCDACEHGTGEWQMLTGQLVCLCTSCNAGYRLDMEDLYCEPLESAPEAALT
eukprot:CAMPEP_0117573876 /NCGR_PEP_ID=MMETSP0784-20121206/61235_1 /TAXON_ID=39447 /ORGANISM="" /LENGTH=160 /DNA_ID=CAMNT_0005372565 /DNA_START=20 /DNA_END=498 /DNA_ORIENTATION=+